MKKIFTIAFALISFILTVNAQWNGTSPLWTNSKIGIGISSPTSSLSIYTTTRNAGNNSVDINAPSIGPNISHIHYGTTGDWYIRSASSSGKVVLQDAGGSVAIGTTDPGEASLKVYKSSLPSFELQSSISRLQIGMATSDWSFAYGARSGDAVLRTLGGTNSLVLYMPNTNNDGSSYIAFGDDANNLWMKIFNNKIVRVAGTIVANRIQVKTDVWSDYVFNPDYKLSTLEEIETYIKEKKHLPDVPSANQVIEDGIDVAQMNAILLKKIEELTLLMIEQNKTIKDLQKKVNDLQK